MGNEDLFRTKQTLVNQLVCPLIRRNSSRPRKNDGQGASNLPLREPGNFVTITAIGQAAPPPMVSHGDVKSLSPVQNGAG